MVVPQLICLSRETNAEMAKIVCLIFVINAIVMLHFIFLLIFPLLLATFTFGAVR